VTAVSAENISFDLATLQRSDEILAAPIGLSDAARVSG
jgi:hypothetical protein